MKTLPKIFLFAIAVVLFTDCERTKSGDADITYKEINKEYVLIRDVNMLRASDDEISNHVDSILSGFIDEEFISTGQKEFDLDDNPLADIGFEIIDLNQFNPGGLPGNFDSLAARVIPINLEILDNSTYGYPDALDLDSPIFEDGHWSARTSVLGTFMNAGQFQGKGNKYLAIRLNGSEDFKYGWIKVYCSQHNDTLRIIEYAYNRIEGSGISAGQKE